MDRPDMAALVSLEYPMTGQSARAAFIAGMGLVMLADAILAEREKHVIRTLYLFAGALAFAICLLLFLKI